MNIFQKINELIDDVLLPEDVQEELRLGERALMDDELDLAIRHFMRARQKKSDHPEIHYKLALAYYYAERYTLAKKSAKQALRYREDFPEIYQLLGLILLEEKNTNRALELFKEAIRLKPDSTENYEYMGIAYAKSENHQQAITAFRKALRLKPQQISVQLHLVESSLALKDYQTAQSILENILQQAPQNGKALYLLGQLTFETGNIIETVMYLQAAIAADYDTPSTRHTLAKALIKKGDTLQAKQILEKIIDQHPQNIAIRLTLIDAYLILNETERAMSHIKPILSLENIDHSEQIQTYLKLGRAYLQSSNPKEARTAYQQATKLAVDCIDAWEGLARAEFALNHINAAVQAIKTAIELQPEHIKLHLFLAECLIKQKEYDAAIQAGKTVLKYDPANLIAKKLLKIAHTQKEEKTTPSQEIPAGAPVELIHILDKTLIKLHQHMELQFMGSRVSALRESLDLPLLVTIMGEFNTGKSTFINSLIGEMIAPMGIRPTTATINYLKYGTMKKLRIIWQNGEVEEAEIGRLAEYADEQMANFGQIRQIQWVEILYPLEILKDVNIVDTPGLNVSLKEHEAITKNFVERADAVIWLFAVDQAGKQTEKDALEFLKTHAKKTVGVVNKIDLVSAKESVQVVDEIQQELKEYVAGVVGVSAKQALEGKLDDQTNKIKDSGFHQLEEFLHNSIFYRSRQIKYQSILHQLNDLFTEIKHIKYQIDTQYQNEQAQYHEITKKIETIQHKFQRQWIPEQLKIFKNGLNKLYLQLAQYIVDSTIDRGFWEGMVLNPEDQKYVRQTLNSGINDVLNQCQETITKQIQQALTRLPSRMETETTNIHHVFEVLTAYFDGVLDTGILEKTVQPNQNMSEVVVQFKQFHPSAAKIRLKKSLESWQKDYFAYLRHFYTDQQREQTAQHLELDLTVFQPLDNLDAKLNELLKSEK